MTPYNHRIEVWNSGTYCAYRVQREFFTDEECDKAERHVHYNDLCARYNGHDNVTIVRGDAPDNTVWETDAIGWAEWEEARRYEHDFIAAIESVPVGDFVFTYLGGYSNPLLHRVKASWDGPFMEVV